MNKNRLARLVAVALLVVSNVLFGFPADMVIKSWNESKIVDNLYLSLQDARVVDKGATELPTLTQSAQAANFSMQSGYWPCNHRGWIPTQLGHDPGQYYGWRHGV